MLRLLLFVLLAATAGSQLSAQDTNWTLERAVEYALDNNLQVRRLNNLTELSANEALRARRAALPTVSGSTNVGAQFGRTIDPTTDAFAQQTIGFQSYNVQVGALIYGGGRLKNQRMQADLDEQAARVDARITGNNIGLQVANSYLTVVLLREQLANARAQRTLSTEQLANTNRLIDAGALAPAQRFDLTAQVAANDRQIVELENQINLAILGLQLLLELDPDEEFNIVTPNLEIDDADLFGEYNLAEVMTSAQSVQPTIMAAELRQESAARGIEVARAGLRPTVSAFGSLSTNYSTVAKDFLNPDVSNVQVVQGDAVPVVINGVPGTIANFSTTGLVFPDLGYFNQLDQNFGQSVGVALNVPIYSQGNNKINVQQAEIQRLNANLDVEQARNQLRNDVQLALADLRAAQQSYRAAQASFEASQAAYDNTQRLFAAGNANSLDLVTATNRLDQARTELTRTKFQLIFNRQVIQFYLGQGLRLD